MLNWFKKKKKDTPKEYDFRWYGIEPENPFNKKMLDIRSYTGTMLALTSEKEVAEKYNELRYSNGEYLIKTNIENKKTSDFNLTLPHNGETLHGNVFRADSMDCKWDIYSFENAFFFSKSWSGELVYKAKFKLTPTSIQIYQIEHPADVDKKTAANDIHYLIKTHALDQPIPHNIPEYLKTDIDIAYWSFIKFGNRAYYATYEDVTNTTVASKK